MATTPISKTVSSTDGTAIYAEAIGDFSKPHIVFLHGITLSASVFDNIFLNPAYQAEYYLVRYDLRGHGRSGKPETAEQHSSKLYADDFASVVKEFQLIRPVFVGWSLGGIVAADIAAHLPPDTLSGVVYLCSIVDTHTMKSVTTARSNEIFTVLLNPESTFEAVRKTAIDLSDAIFDLESDLGIGSVADLEERRRRRWDAQNAWLGSTLHQNARQRQLVGSRVQDPEPLLKLGADGFPVLALYGAQDTLLDARRMRNQFVDRFTNLRVVEIERAGGHAPFQENHEEVMEHIGRFAKHTHRK